MLHHTLAGIYILSYRYTVIYNTTYNVKGTWILFQFLFLMEKSILYG